MKINENLINTMKVLRGQEASLESSKALYRGSRLALTDATPTLRKSIKIKENLWESMKYELPDHVWRNDKWFTDMLYKYVHGKLINEYLNKWINK